MDHTPDQNAFRLLLAVFEPSLRFGDMAFAQPLGAPADLVAHIKALLPGATFDAGGQGVFHRSTYHITFAMSGEEPTSIAVTVDRAEGFTALHRLIDKMGWRAVDAATGAFVDLEASRTAAAIVPLGPDPVPVARPEEREPPRRRVLVKAAAGGGVVLALLFAWEWSRRVTGIPKRVFTPAELGTAPASGPPPTGEAVARTRAFIDQMNRDAQRMQVVMRYIKILAPEFRNDPIVYQVLEYRQATVFPGFVGEDGYLSPTQLSDKRIFERLQTPPYLPPSFAQSKRNGYAFEFAGEHCGKPTYLAKWFDEICKAGVYSAVPLDRTQKEHRSYAFFSADDRIHYRTDGELPTRSDPTVDNTAPSMAADVPGGAPTASQTPAESTLGKAIDGLLKMAGFGSRATLTRQQHESMAVQDLRRVFAAENMFNATLGEGRYYYPPERLADPALTERFKQPPFLPGYFVQPLRQGYHFEFLGEKPQAAAGALAYLGTVYESFVYVATPVDPGPAGRQTFAMYWDGLVFSTSDRRVPTRQDTPLGGR